VKKTENGHSSSERAPGGGFRKLKELHGSKRKEEKLALLRKNLGDTTIL
jgi:hypothetical protein